MVERYWKILNLALLSFLVQESEAWQCEPQKWFSERIEFETKKFPEGISIIESSSGIPYLVNTTKTPLVLSLKDYGGYTNYKLLNRKWYQTNYRGNFLVDSSSDANWYQLKERDPFESQGLNIRNWIDRFVLSVHQKTGDGRTSAVSIPEPVKFQISSKFGDKYIDLHGSIIYSLNTTYQADAEKNCKERQRSYDLKPGKDVRKNER